jgi:hypothetical protein
LQIGVVATCRPAVGGSFGVVQIATAAGGLTTRASHLRNDRQLQREDASLAWEVTNADRAAVGFGCPANDRETEAEPGAIATSLGIRLEQLVELTVG